MSIHHQSQIAETLKLTTAAGGQQLLRRAVVASTSLLAMSAALGWSDPALAAGTCGAPTAGVVNCNLTAYPGGINYSAGNAVDDLTVNVGTFAGQSGAVTIGGGPGILVANNPGSTGDASQSVYVGKNVSIATTGAYASGIAVDSFANSFSGVGSAYSGAYATVKNSGAITVSGQGADGIAAATITAPGPGYTEAVGYATAIGTTTVYNGGAIATSGAPSAGGPGADGIFAESIQASLGDAGSRAIATSNVVNAGSITTSGDLAAGVYATATGEALSPGGFATGGAYVNVTNTGAISTTGQAAAGIYAKTTGFADSGYKGYAYSVATVVNAGAISTTGAGSVGIAVEAVGEVGGFFASAYASANVVNAGSITTTGAGAAGIDVLAGDMAAGLLSAPYANATVVNSGDIKTAGVGSIGVEVISSTYAASYYVYSAARSTVTNAGAISTTGAGSVGVLAVSVSTAASPTTLAHDFNGKTYAASTVTNVGSITTAGAGAVGVVAQSTASSYSVSYSRALAFSTVTNAGAIETAGAGAYGVVAKSKSTAYVPLTSVYSSIASATSTVTNVGAIATTGAGANGIIAYSKAVAIGSASSASSTATTMVTNAGAVSSAQGIGILAYSASYAHSTAGSSAKASSTVINAGSVSAAGANGIGVYAVSLAGTNTGPVTSSATVVNVAGGSISALGAGGIGVKAEAGEAAVVTYAGSSIEGGTGAGAVGVYAHGAAAIVTNGGSIGSGNSHAVSLNGIYYAVLTNTGTVTGYATLTTTGQSSTALPGATAFLNYGTWVAEGGNTVLTHAVGGPASNLVNEPGGTIVVVGSQTFTADTFTNLGLLTMTQAASANLGARPAFETLTVSGDYDGIGGTLAVDASTAGGMQGDVLKITGAASGGTKVKPTIVGTPGATTGNGILLVSANATTGAGNFTLAGNASNGDEVAGSFEYNLDFVPGAGTSGDWYLQSQLYPGVYQFGQIQSSTLLISDTVNPSVDDLLNQAFNGVVKGASLDDTSQQVASADNSFVPPPNGPGVSGWGRFAESRFSVDPNGSSFADYKLRVDAAQFGLDYDWHNATNNVLFGGYITPFNAFSDFASLGGHIKTSGTAYGIYGLWFSGPWEAGVRLNVDNDTARFTDTFIGTNAMTKPDEKGIQAAASYDMAFDWANFTPSAEFNYGTVNGSHFTDGAGNLVQISSTDDLWGKINGRFSWDVQTDRGLLVQPYVNVGVLYRGDTGTNVGIAGFTTATNVNGFNGDFALGVNTNLAANLSLSAQGDYLAGNRINGWTGFLGLRYTP